MCHGNLKLYYPMVIIDKLYTWTDICINYLWTSGVTRIMHNSPNRWVNYHIFWKLGWLPSNSHLWRPGGKSQGRPAMHWMDPIGYGRSVKVHCHRQGGHPQHRAGPEGRQGIHRMHGWLIHRIISVHVYVYKCAMVIWNYITGWFF